MRSDKDLQNEQLQLYGHMHKLSPYFFTVSLVVGFLVYWLANKQTFVVPGSVTNDAIVFVYMALSTVAAYGSFRLYNWYMGRQPLTLVQLQFMHNQRWSQPAADALCAALCDSTPSALQAKQLWNICRLQIEAEHQSDKAYALHLAHQERVKRDQIAAMLHERFCVKNAHTK